MNITHEILITVPDAESAAARLGGFSWVLKRADLLSVFVRGDDERSRCKIRIAGIPYREYAVTRPPDVPQELAPFVIDGRVFCRRRGRMPRPPGTPLVISSGSAFGYDHPATRLTLETLVSAKSLWRNGRALDLGTGSGILAVYLATAGARIVRAIDIDPFVVREAARNLRRNGIGRRRASVELRDVRSFRTPFRLIAANVPANVHTLNAAVTVSLLAPEGLLVAGGIESALFGDVRRAYGALTLREQRECGDWTTAVFAREKE